MDANAEMTAARDEKILKLKIDILLKDFDRVKWEIHNRVEYRQRLIQAQIQIFAILAALTGAVAGFSKGPASQQGNSYEQITIFLIIFLPILSMLYSIILQEISVQDYYRFKGAQYINHYIRPKLAELCQDTTLMEWESHLRIQPKEWTFDFETFTNPVKTLKWFFRYICQKDLIEFSGKNMEERKKLFSDRVEVDKRFVGGQLLSWTEQRDTLFADVGMNMLVQFVCGVGWVISICSWLFAYDANILVLMGSVVLFLCAFFLFAGAWGRRVATYEQALYTTPVSDPDNYIILLRTLQADFRGKRTEQAPGEVQ